jgi:DNA-binding CsgD family transcriptional regulator
MSNERDLTEIEHRLLEALAIQRKEALYNQSVSDGISDEKLARQLGISVEEVREAMRRLVELGYARSEPAPPPAKDIGDPWPSPMPPCQRCGKPADGLDYFCTRCRAIHACDLLCDRLTNALENFLDDRWSPHEYDKPRPA